MKYSISQQKLQRKNVFIAHFLQQKNANILQKLQRYFIIFKFAKSHTNPFFSLNRSFNNSIIIENISYLKILFPHNLFLNLTCIIINQFQILPYQNPSPFENNNYIQIQVQNPASHHENYFFSYFYQLPAMQQNQACIFFTLFANFFPSASPDP